MKKIFGILLVIVLFISNSTVIFAEETKLIYGTVNVEYSDNKGNIETLNVMTLNNNVYADAEELVTRLGYQISFTSEDVVTIYNKTNSELPYGFTIFYYDDTKVEHMIFSKIINKYEAPFKTVKINDVTWIPLEYSLLILNSSQLIINDTLLIDIPEKNIVDYFSDIMKNTNDYLFDFSSDFGYTDSDITKLTYINYFINELNGLITFDGDSWLQLIQTLVLNHDAYDNKYGENIAMLLCTESNGELEALKSEIEKYSDIFSENGKIGQLLITVSNNLDADVDSLYKTCENILKDIKKGNSNYSTYNRAYKMLEKAFDKQTLFSNTGKVILDTQKRISGTTNNCLNIFSNIAEVVQYATEFNKQDEYSVKALKTFLNKSRNDTVISDTVKETMKNYTDDLELNVAEYSAKRYWEENIDNWIANLTMDTKLIGSQANIALLCWDLASDYIPFISDGLEAADKFNLAIYSSILQADSFNNYQTKRSDVFNDAENITTENLYELSQHCYIFLKMCYISREAALSSLVNKSDLILEQIQPLIEKQNSINENIGKMLVKLKTADENNDDMVYGFLPENNEDYLDTYNDDYLFEIIHENNQDSLIIGAWEDIKEREVDYLEDFNGITIFKEDGTITRTINNEKENGTYVVSVDGKTVTATMTEHYYNYPCIEPSLCGWIKTPNYSEILTFEFINIDTLMVTSNLSNEDFFTDFHNNIEIYRTKQ